jgi:predicted O-linked N-acetylglucosamine transferase (SPINDLY family)
MTAPMQPDLAAAFALHQAGRAAEAEAAYARIPIDGPQGPDALFLRGILAYQALRPAEAVPLIARAVALRPETGPFYIDLGSALQACDRLDDAARAMLRGLAFDRASPAIRHNLDRLAYSYARQSVFRREVADLAAAGRAMRRAMLLGPGVPEAHFAHGTFAFSHGLCVEACNAFLRSVHLRPDFASANSDYLFALCFRDDVSREEVLAAHRAFDRKHMQKLPRLPARPRAGEDPSRQLVVGYVSPDLRTHPGGNFLTPMIRHHDPAGFRLIAYYSNDAEDDFTRLCRAHSQGWVPCKDMSDEDLARRIHADRVDILVECAGHMARNRLGVFARKPAPVQASFPLYPNTTGLEAIDYRIGDPYFTPPWLDRFYAEKIMRLPETCACYMPGFDGVEPAETLPARANGHVTFGSFNNIAKLSPTTLRLWARIMQRVPTARLVIKWAGLGVADPFWISGRFRAHGIDLARVRFLGSTPSVYAPYRDIDICLDPFPANGGTTTSDALWMGVPVVTLAGDTTFSRAGLGLLTNLGLPELATSDEHAYVDLAVALAGDLDRLEALRSGLRQRFTASPMMDGARYVRHLEAAFRDAWKRWCAGA